MAGRIIVKPGMLGIDPDDLTASAGDVLKGKIAGVAGNDEPVTGTLALTGNIGAADIRKGKKGYSTDPKKIITGTMAEQAAQTITPGTANKTIAANRFLIGVQTISGDKNLIGANIIRGKTIFGVAGEAVYAGDTPGYFLEPPKEYENITGGWSVSTSSGVNTNFYLSRGTTYYTLTGNTSNGYPRTNMLFTEAAIDMSQYRTLYVEFENCTLKTGNTVSKGAPVYIYFGTGTTRTVNSFAGGGSSSVKVGTLSTNGASTTYSGTISFDVSNITAASYIKIYVATGVGTDSTSEDYFGAVIFTLNIKRIWGDKIQ